MCHGKNNKCNPYELFKLNKMNSTLNVFEDIIKDFPDQISAIKEKELNIKPSPERWSKKEILGHLIDSAIINYQRFVRAQFEENPHVFYTQDDYCKAANYQNVETQQLINLWTAMNQQLLFLFGSIIERKLTHRKANDHTLDFLMKDYVAHLNHHKAQILTMKTKV